MVALSRLRSLDAMVGQLRAAGRPPDLIHAHFFSSGLFAVLVGKRRGVPVLVSEHLSDVQEGRVHGWDATVARYTYRSAGVVCPVSRQLEQSVLSLEPRARTETVANVVDIEAFANVRSSRVPERNGSRRLLTVARLAPKKGVHDLLEALRSVVVDCPNVRLEIAGDGPERQRLELLARGLPVTFLGAQARDGVVERMRHADVLVLPSLVETFGITAIEGLAAGLRVVATSAFAVADVVTEFGGLVSPPADPAGLAASLRKALRTPSLAQEEGLGELRARFGLEAIAARWDEIYSRIEHRRETS